MFETTYIIHWRIYASLGLNELKVVLQDLIHSIPDLVIGESVAMV